jgi:hypothetical protein
VKPQELIIALEQKIEAFACHVGDFTENIAPLKT